MARVGQSAAMRYVGVYGEEQLTMFVRPKVIDNDGDQVDGSVSPDSNVFWSN